MAIAASSRVSKRNEIMKLMATFILGTMFGTLIGIYLGKVGFTSTLMFGSSYIEPHASQGDKCSQLLRPTLPYGSESLPPDIIVPHTDLYLRRLWGNPEEDPSIKPKYLLSIAAGLDQRELVDKEVSKFSRDWMVMLFHYDGQIDGWDQYEWSQRAIHISAKEQTKWWFAKRFLHPDVVEPFKYIFIWDEDLNVQNFDAEAYIRLVEKHGLEISQPAVEPAWGSAYQIVKRRDGIEVHKDIKENTSQCPQGPPKPPCASFIEITAPVFSRKAWRCVWHMIQNDLVHAWGLDFALHHCVELSHDKMGVVDAQWIRHEAIPSLGGQKQGKALGMQLRKEVHIRCQNEWQLFEGRLRLAFEKAKKNYSHE